MCSAGAGVLLVHSHAQGGVGVSGGATQRGGAGAHGGGEAGVPALQLMLRRGRAAVASGVRRQCARRVVSRHRKRQQRLQGKRQGKRQGQRQRQRQQWLPQRLCQHHARTLAGHATGAQCTPTAARPVRTAGPSRRE